MSGITDLPTLLQTLAPIVSDEEYVFATIRDESELTQMDPIGVFREKEAITVICRRSQAQAAGLPFEGSYRQITLSVHSSLQAVGLLAAVTAALAAEGIPCNAVSAFYHDHLFVPAHLAAQAVSKLSQLSFSKHA